MANNPSTLPGYNGQTSAPNANYTYGSARDDASPGDLTGTPRIAAEVNDILGFQQALLNAAAVVPSGSPDTAQVSQYLEALRKYQGLLGAFVFNTVADLQAGTTAGGKTIVFYDGQIVATPSASWRVGASGDFALVGGLFATAQGIIDAADFGADANSADTSAALQVALDSGYSIAISKPYFARGLDLTINDKSIYFFGAGHIKNPDGVNGEDLLTVSGNNNVIYDAVVDGNGVNDPGGTLAGGNSLSGIVLNGHGNKVARGNVFGVGKLLTSGDQGAGNQVGVGYGGASDDPQQPNVFEDCLGYNCGNYGFNPRANTSIVRGGSWGNGTNGLGNRFCSNFHVDGHNIGVQYQGNPDTASVGMTLDTESIGHPDYQKLSRDCSFKNMIIEDNEAGSISCSFYTDVLFDNVHAKGDALIQSSKPQVAPDIGQTGAVNVRGLRVDKSLTLLNHQKLILNSVQQNEAVSLGINCDNCDDVDVFDLTTYATLAQFIRIDNLTVRKITGTGQLILDTIPELDGLQVQMDGGAPVTDQKAVQLNSCNGSLTGKIKNYGYPIASSSGNKDMDLSGFEFESCGAADGADQNACVNFKNTNGYTLNGLKFKNCSGRLLYATNMSDAVITGHNADEDCSGGVTIEGGSDGFVYDSNALRGTGDMRIFTGVNNAATVFSNYLGPNVTTSAYPAGWN